MESGSFRAKSRAQGWKGNPTWRLHASCSLAVWLDLSRKTKGRRHLFHDTMKSSVPRHLNTANELAHTTPWGSAQLMLERTTTTTLSLDAGWVMSGLSTALPRRTWGYCWVKIRTWATDVHSQPRRPTVPWAVSPAVWAQGEGGDSAPLLCSGETLPRESCVQLWSPQHRTDLELLEQGQRRPQKWSESWSTSAVRKGWESWGCSACRREGCGETLARPFST